MLKNTILFIAIMCVVNIVYGQSDSAQFYFKKGMDEKAARRYLVAAAYFDKSIKYDGKNVQTFIQNGQVDLEMRKIDAAAGNFSKAYSLDPSNPLVVKELTTLFFNNRQFQKAIDLAQKCNSCPDAERIIAMSYFNLEDYGKAITGLQKYFARKSDDSEVAYFLGKSYLEMEDFKKAIPWYQKAVTLDASKNVWMYELGLIFYTTNNFPEALKYFKMAEAAGYVRSNDFLENIGFSYLNTGDVENGLKNLQTVLSHKPKDKELLANISQAMYSSKKYDDALVYYQKLLELNPKDANALYMAGMTFQKKGQKERGQSMCDEAIKLDPSLAKNRQKRGENVGL